jgi:probable phosphoglycerate mutase
VTGQKMKLTVVRHGETNWNKERRIQGQIDVPLNAKGIAQASAVANKLKAEVFDGIVSSDLSRAKQTADPNKKTDTQLTLEPLIRERHLGVLEGLFVSDAKKKNEKDLRAFQERSFTHTPAGAESMEEFVRRVKKSLTIIHQKFKKSSVLVITHGGVIDILWRLANKIEPGSKATLPIGNGSIHHFIYNPETESVDIESFNQIEHLTRSIVLNDF